MPLGDASDFSLYFVSRKAMLSDSACLARAARAVRDNFSSRPNSDLPASVASEPTLNLGALIAQQLGDPLGCRDIVAEFIWNGRNYPVGSGSYRL